MELYPEGYPRIAAYVNSDVDTVLFRRFGDLHARCLLYREVELNDLEKKLNQRDKKDESKEETEWRVTHGIHHDNGKKNEDRKALIEEVERKLKSYCELKARRHFSPALTVPDDLLLLESKMRKLPRPSERVHRNFMDYIYTENPFGESDIDFIFHEQDFVSLENFEESWLDQLIHRLMGHATKGIFRVRPRISRIMCFTNSLRKYS